MFLRPIHFRNLNRALALALSISISATTVVQACTRVVYRSHDQVYTARSMDWFEDLNSDFWAFPRGMEKDGGMGEGSLTWTSKYGSVILSGYDIGTADGLNEAGLSANVLYLAEADYGSDAASDKPTLSVGAWAQYALDNYATVAQAVAGLSKDSFTIIAPKLPDGHAAGLHLSLSDATGDSAIVEYVKGALVIHHGSEFNVMTNSPVFDEQLALNAYWSQIGGTTMLPGTNRAADRFSRAKFYADAVPEFEDERYAASAAFSIIRNASVPLGITDPDQPNIATTIWRIVADHKNLRYYFESAISPNAFWVDIKNVDLSETASPQQIDLDGHPVFAGDISSKFKPAEPFKWLSY